MEKALERRVTLLDGELFLLYSK